MVQPKTVQRALKEATELRAMLEGRYEQAAHSKAMEKEGIPTPAAKVSQASPAAPKKEEKERPSGVVTPKELYSLMQQQLSTRSALVPTPVPCWYSCCATTNG